MYSGARQVSLRVPVTPMVKKIMKINFAVYAISVLMVTVLGPVPALEWFQHLFLYPALLLDDGSLWTLATYAWFHDLGLGTGRSPLMSIVVCAGAIYGIYRLYQSRWGRQEFFLFVIMAFLITALVGSMGFGAPLHVCGNMLGLYFFGHIFEERWGARRFLWFWILCTLGGGVFSTLMFYVWPVAGPASAVVGASAGVMGLIAAYSVYFPNQQVLYGLVVPIKGKYFLIIAIAFDVVNLINGSRIAVFAHFGGIIMSVLLCTGYWRLSKIRSKLGASGGTSKRSHLRVVRDDDDDQQRYLH